MAVDGLHHSLGEVILHRLVVGVDAVLQEVVQPLFRVREVGHGILSVRLGMMAGCAEGDGRIARGADAWAKSLAPATTSMASRVAWPTRSSRAPIGKLGFTKG